VFGVAGDDCDPVADCCRSQERANRGEHLAALARLGFPSSPELSAIEIDGQQTLIELAVKSRKSGNTNRWAEPIKKKRVAPGAGLRGRMPWLCDPSIRGTRRPMTVLNGKDPAREIA